MTRAAIYARVSTNSQNCENQLLELRAVSQRMNWTVAAERFGMRWANTYETDVFI